MGHIKNLVQRFEKGPSNLKTNFGFAVRLLKYAFLWHNLVLRVREPRSEGWIRLTDEVQRCITEDLEGLGISVDDYWIDIDEYRSYMRKANYGRFQHYYRGGTASGFIEKSVEHFIAADLLDLREDDVYVDIASANSPTPWIYQSVFRCKAFRQDLTYPPGVHGRTIGGDAAHLPFQDESITKMALHCSFEHFEGDSDERFVDEASRVIRPGGCLCIVPLYLFDRYAIMTDLAVCPRNGVSFDKSATVYCAKGYGNRHGRFYDSEHLTKRVLNRASMFKTRFFVVRNRTEISPDCYLRFLATFTKQ